MGLGQEPKEGDGRAMDDMGAVAVIMDNVGAGDVIVVLLIVFVLLLIRRGVRIAPQSEVCVVERSGKHQRTLPAGLNLIVPFLDVVSHRISVLERQLPEFTISVITRDNVEVNLQATVFYRIADAAHSVHEGTPCAVRPAAA